MAEESSGYATSYSSSTASGYPRRYSLPCTTSIASLQVDLETIKDPLEYLQVMKTTKNSAKLLYVCQKLALYFQDGDDEPINSLSEEEVVRVLSQVMINHPLNPNILQYICEILKNCNQRPEYRHFIEEYEVYRPLLTAIKNHKKNPYFLSTALHALASISESALSCKGLRQSKAYKDVISVLLENKFDVQIQIGGLAALRFMLRDDLFAQNFFVQVYYHKTLHEIIRLHFQKPAVIINSCLLLRLLASLDTCRESLLKCEIFETCLELLKVHEDDPDVVASSCGLIESLSKSSSFIEYTQDMSNDCVHLGQLLFSCLKRHSNSEDVCCYCFSTYHYIAVHSDLMTDLKHEDILKFMHEAYDKFSSSSSFQESYCRCLSSLLECNSDLHMFVGDGDKNDSELRIPLLNQIWIILLSNIQDTQNYNVFEAVCLAIYYIVVDSERLRKILLNKGAALAIYEGLRRFIGFTDAKFERSLQYSCQALVPLIMTEATEVKEYLVNVDIIYDLIDILDHHMISPDVAVEALSVIACLSDNEKFRKTASDQSIYIKILSLMQYKPAHAVLIESAVEVLIVFIQLDKFAREMFNESGIFREVIDILNRELGDTINCKCLMLLHLLADEDYLSLYPKDSYAIGWILQRLLTPTQDTLLLIEALVCACTLCKSCPNFIPQVLVECEIDVNMFMLLYSQPGTDEDSPDYLIYELAIDVVHSLSLTEGCCHKMLLSAIRHCMIEAVKLLVDIGADINGKEDANSDIKESPIYQAVTTCNSEVVECVLGYNITNKNSLKESLLFAKRLQQDAIIGLLLKALGLNKEKRYLNIGGLGLQYLKSSWLYPSFGLKMSDKVKTHRRHGSFDRVINGLKVRRKSSQEAPVPFAIMQAGMPIMDVTMATAQVAMATQSAPVQRRSNEAEDTYRLSKSWEPHMFQPFLTHMTKSSSNKRRVMASRPPALSTVVSSPLFETKVYLTNNSDNLSKSVEHSLNIGNSKILHRVLSQEGVDMVDGPLEIQPFEEKKEKEREEEEEEEEKTAGVRIPYRRHVDIMKSITGTNCVAFNTFDLFQRNTSGNNNESSIVRTDSITDLVNPHSDPLPNIQVPAGNISQIRIKKAAKRSRRKKDFYYSSGSASPFVSSGEGSAIVSYEVNEKLCHELLASVATLTSEKRSELLSSLTISAEGTRRGGVDEVDMPSSSRATPTSFSYMLLSMDLSSNKLHSLDSFDDTSINLKLREVFFIDAKQNCLSELPPQMFQMLILLQRLILSQNSFKCLPPEISFCCNLVEVDLSNNKINTFPDDRVILMKLERLNLNNNSFEAFPIALNGDCFPNLKHLQLNSNQISHIEDKDFKLKNLQELYINRNCIKKIPFTFLVGLTSLKTLDISRNSLELIPSEAAEYTCSLQELKVSNNKLHVNEHEFYSFITAALLIQLVDASNNDLVSVPPPYMWSSRGLKHLLLKANKITSIDLSDGDKFWPQLERLVLAENKLKEIPADMGKLKILSCLDISHNQAIRSLPNEMGKLEYLFYLNMNGLKNLDIDRTLSAKAVVRYLRAKLIQSKPCYSMKMTVVGAAGKGKTTLLHLLMNEKASRPENTATLGVQIRKWIYQQRPGVNYEISCWDFAGQEEFYSTHQCFLTPRSIYILVYNISKAESELDALIPWLLNIQARAPSSPVIIVGTHRDLIADELFRKVRKSMRDRINEIVTKPGFPKDISFAEISCVGQKVGLDNLRAKIKEKIDGAKLRGQKIMGEMVPASYLELKSMLEEESKRLSKAKSNLHIIRKHELEELIRRGNLSQNLDKIEIEQAVQFLHECGTLLHYDDIQSNLSDLYFVDPQWLCSLMARIITLKQLTIISKGILLVKDLPLLLRGSQFPSNFTNEYIRLLEWFDVALQFSPDQILIPSYLSKIKTEPISLPQEDKIIRRYNLCFIPPGFWPRLVIRLLSFPRRAIQMTEPTKQTYWYCGLYSYWSPQEYYLIEQSQKKKNEFDITVPNSTMGIRLLCSVVDNVESLIDEWFPGLRNIDIESGDTLVLTSALCPFCPAYNVHTFPIKQLQKESINNDEVTCPVHNGPVPLKLLSPDIIISDLGSKYHILRKDIQMDENSPSSLLGKGGFGEVYKAIYDNRTVAVKLFYPHMAEMHNTTPNQLIRQEISILSQLDHPYIIRLEGVCLRPKPMMILEFAGLGSLTSFSPYSNVSSNLKHRIMLQIVSALAFLHKNKVIYRDLKPGNILIFSINLNEAVNAKLSDYGISTYVTAAGTSQDIGTAGYKAPELLKAKTSKMPYTNKVDIYSLGIVLFELITNGHTPFEELSPLERDKAIEENRFIKNPAYYGCAPWPDMYDMIEHCLQYIPSKRPTAQEMFDRMCYPEFVALRQVIHIHDDWEILTFTVRKSHDNKSEIWLSSCDESQQSMLTVINLSQRTKQPQGKIIEQNSAVCCIVAVGQLVLLGTSLGDILVFESYDKKEHRLAPLPDSVLCFCYVKKKNEKSYLFAGLANGGLAVFNYEVLTTPKSKHEVLLSLNKGPVKAIKKYHSCLYVISGLEVIVIKLFPIAINFKWTACEDISRKFLTYMEVGDDIVWTSYNKGGTIQGWDVEDGSHRMDININSFVPKLDVNSSVGGASSHVTSIYLQWSAPPLLWVGTSTGHLLIIDTTSGNPLIITRRHFKSVRNICASKMTIQDRPANVVLTSGVGFNIRPTSKDTDEVQPVDNYGVLLIWDGSMSQVKSTFDEMKKQQLLYQ